jgi:hypothetical protein
MSEGGRNVDGQGAAPAVDRLRERRQGTRARVVGTGPDNVGQSRYAIWVLQMRDNPREFQL